MMVTASAEDRAGTLPSTLRRTLQRIVHDTAPGPTSGESSAPANALANEALEDLRLAHVSRFLDDREIALRQQNRAFFQISGAGHESLLLALARHLRAGYDWFFPYYRDRALALALGVTPTEMLMQAVGAAGCPASGGRQMPCHWGAKHLNIVSQTSVTASQCLPAVGCAEAARYIGRRPDLPGCVAHGDEVTYVSLGEGATSEGEFWESLNTACRLHLPVLYVVADNGYAISVRSTDQHPAPISEMVRGIRGLHVVKMDGRDYFEVRRKGANAIAHVRAGAGPTLIHALVTRPYSHSLSDDQKKYRSPDELADEREHDPITVLEQQLIAMGAVTADAAEQLRVEAKEVVRAAADDALAAPRPSPESVIEHVVGPPPVRDDPGDPEIPGDAEPVTFGEAIRLTLHEQMALDERIRVFGEDVADADPHVIDEVPGKGGVFGITFGLQRAFGESRCYNTPLAEANIIGRANGQAIRGLRPCPEIQFFDYVWPAMNQIKSEVATTRWRSNGAFTSPMVIRIPIGGYLQGGAIYHSQCGESIFAHVPGLLIAFPSRARDAAGLLRTAFRGEDPVLFLEHKHLYRQGYNRDPMPPPEWMLPFGRGAYATRGDRVTVVTWGATVRRAVVAAGELGPDAGIEIVDLRTIAPWDREIVAESVHKTGRVLVVHEDVLTCGFGAEVAAFVAEECFESLDAPVWRLAAADTPVAYEPSLENAILPQVTDIKRDLEALLAY
jgi:2-oxoisovalerate dehydrogenase E1 component